MKTTQRRQRDLFDFYPTRHQVLIRLLESESPGRDLLDLGGSSGHLRRSLPETTHYYVLDADLEALKIARSEGADVILADLNSGRIPFKDKSFDRVVCTEVLEHLIRPRLILTEIKRILGHDGYAVISLPNELSLIIRLRVLFGYPIDLGGLEFKYDHLHFPNYQQILNFISSELNIERIDYWELESKKRWNPPRFLRRLLARIYPPLFARAVFMKTRA